MAVGKPRAALPEGREGIQGGPRSSGCCWNVVGESRIPTDTRQIGDGMFGGFIPWFKWMNSLPLRPRRVKPFYAWKVWNGDTRGAMTSRRNNSRLCRAPFWHFCFDSRSVWPLRFAFLRPRRFSSTRKIPLPGAPGVPKAFPCGASVRDARSSVRWNLGLNHREKHPQNSGVWLQGCAGTWHGSAVIYSVATGEVELPGKKPWESCEKMEKTSGSFWAKQDFRFRTLSQGPKFVPGLEFF